jgi:hypothetical protein
VLSGENFPVLPRIELGPALQQADALPTQPHRTITQYSLHHYAHNNHRRLTYGSQVLISKKIRICEAILVKMTCKFKIDQTKAIFDNVLLKTPPFELQWSYFDFE